MHVYIFTDKSVWLLQQLPHIVCSSSIEAVDNISLKCSISLFLFQAVMITVNSAKVLDYVFSANLHTPL